MSMNAIPKSSRPKVFCKMNVLKNFAKFTGKHLRQGLFFNKVEKETMAQMFSCEFCKVFKNTYFYRTSLVAASEYPTDKNVCGDLTH